MNFRIPGSAFLVSIESTLDLTYIVHVGRPMPSIGLSLIQVTLVLLSFPTKCRPTYGLN